MAARARESDGTCGEIGLEGGESAGGRTMVPVVSQRRRQDDGAGGKTMEPAAGERRRQSKAAVLGFRTTAGTPVS